MPGIFINDGGQIGSSLSSAISRIADNYSPKTQAEAQMLRQQTEAADWNNRKQSSLVPAMEQEANAIGNLADGIPSGSQVADSIAKRTNPTMSYGGSPSSQRGVVSTSGMGNMAKILAARALQGADTQELTKGLDYTHDMAAPGSDPTTQTDIVKARQMPVAVNEGQSYYLNPSQAAGAGGAPAPAQPGVTPAVSDPSAQPAATPTPTRVAGNGGVLGGPDAYTHAAQTGTAAVDVKDMNEYQKSGNDALAAQHEASSIRDLYNLVQKDGGLGSQLSSQAQKAILDYTGIAVTSKAQALQEIATRMNKMMVGLRGPLGIQRVAGPEITLLQNMLAGGTMTPQVFNDVMNSMEGAMKQSADIGQAAAGYNNSPTQQTAADIRSRVAQISASDPVQALRDKYPSLFPKSGTMGGTGGGGDDAQLPHPATPEEAAKLPPGTRFVTPDGKHKVR